MTLSFHDRILKLYVFTLVALALLLVGRILGPLVVFPASSGEQPNLYKIYLPPTNSIALPSLHAP
jgi:hypothetical protein